MRASSGSLGISFPSSFALLLLGGVLLVGGGLSGCTLITDVDRERIPQPVSPPFSEVDAGPEPPISVPEAGVPDASVPSEEAPPDAGDDAGPSDAGVAGDAAADAA